PWKNTAFYTTDGMRFEVRKGTKQHTHLKLYENPEIVLCTLGVSGSFNEGGACGGCGSLGLHNNTDETLKPPCLLMVDVNGDRKPNPANIDCKTSECAKPYKFSDPDGKKLTDLFTIMITDKQAIPYGVAAQRAMYNSQK
ncbi:MAG: hypothetical protein Q4F80_05075, partial [bacterium]|nr:hypothetical protein [bacterium]